jgi:hypothetical protein
LRPELSKAYVLLFGSILDPRWKRKGWSDRARVPLEGFSMQASASATRRGRRQENDAPNAEYLMTPERSLS